MTECLTFLTDRLHEELARVWALDRPGMPAHVAVLDDLLLTVRSGYLPDPRDLRILLYGYGTHADYDPAWSALANHAR